jgi:hypothetical protein
VKRMAGKSSALSVGFCIHRLRPRKPAKTSCKSADAAIGGNLDSLQGRRGGEWLELPHSAIRAHSHWLAPIEVSFSPARPGPRSCFRRSESLRKKAAQSYDRRRLERCESEVDRVFPGKRLDLSSLGWVEEKGKPGIMREMANFGGGHSAASVRLCRVRDRPWGHFTGRLGTGRKEAGVICTR